MTDASMQDDQMQDDSATMGGTTPANGGFYSNDVQAAAVADNNMDPDSVEEEDELPVTSGDMEIGDLDATPAVGQGSEESEDEEMEPAGDNVSDS